MKKYPLKGWGFKRRKSSLTRVCLNCMWYWLLTKNHEQDMQNYLIRNVQVVNEGVIFTADVLLKNGRIEKVEPRITLIDTNVIEINGEGKFLRSEERRVGKECRSRW